jgi:opacity protein-like surface antigen
MVRLRNGWYIGVAGAAEIPSSNFNNVYRTGWGVEVPIGWDPVNSPLGIRANLGYATLRSKTDLPFTVNNPQIWQAVADLKLRAPFQHGLLSAIYGVGGGGAYVFRNYGSPSTTIVTTTTPGATYQTIYGSSNSSSTTRFGWNAGGGIQFGIGSAALYAESRYVHVSMPGAGSSYIPIALGLTWNF